MNLTIYTNRFLPEWVGLTNLTTANSGYNRYVVVETPSKSFVRLTYHAGNHFCLAAKDGSINTKYTGTSI